MFDLFWPVLGLVLLAVSIVGLVVTADRAGRRTGSRP